MPSNDGNVGTAFLVVTVAGMSTCIGAALVFFRHFVSLANPRFLAASLAGSAGVMLYVSFIEIFQKSAAEFAATSLGDDPGKGTVYALATSCFFGGILLTYGLRVLVHRLDQHSEIDQYHHGDKRLPSARKLAVDIERSEGGGHERVRAAEDASEVEIAVIARESPAGAGAAADAAQEGEEDAEDVPGRPEAKPRIDLEDGRDMDAKTPLGQTPRELQRMGLLTALAIGLHNFPEGIATFVATLADPRVGIALGVAIAIHNIPEGICVAIPVFYATGSRTKAFLWAVLTGVSEPVGALLAYLILSINEASYGVIFGLVGGMMVFISIQELIPTAHKYDPEDRVSSKAVVAGMAVMAISLVAFGFD